MPDITPINDAKSIMQEANSIPTPPPQPVPTQQPVAMPQVIAQPPVQSTPVQTSVPTTNPIPVIPGPGPGVNPNPLNNVSPQRMADAMKSGFTYRLPVFSYVLTWLYIIAAIIIGGILIYYINMAIQYSEMNSYYSSSSTYNNGVNDVIQSILLLMFLCVTTIVSLMIGTVKSRYVAIAVSAGIIIFGIYKFGQMSSYITGEYFWRYIWSYMFMFLPYLPYVILPIITVIYLFTPKAVSAYK